MSENLNNEKISIIINNYDGKQITYLMPANTRIDLYESHLPSKHDVVWDQGPIIAIEIEIETENDEAIIKIEEEIEWVILQKI